MSIHNKSIRHLEKAKALAKTNDYDYLRYAALELRYAIEFIFYELIPLYRDELPSDIIEKWKPQEIIDAVIDCDPYVEHSKEISIAFEDDQEQPNWLNMGKQSGVSKKILREGYHRLGRFLHAPLNLVNHDLDELRRSVEKAMAVVESFRNDRIKSNIALRHSFTCVCGRQITRNQHALDRNPLVKCPDVKCGAIFEYEKTDNNPSTFKLLEQAIKCPECNTYNYFGAHLLADNVEFSCIECSKKWKLKSAFVIEPANFS